MAHHELIPTGTLRFGVVAAPAQTEFFVSNGADGVPHGVTVELAHELGRRLGAPVEFTVLSSSGELPAMLSAGTLDAAFMPVDDERMKVVDFATLYFVDENTYLVSDASAMRTVDDVDGPGARVVAVVGTATSRTATRILRHATVAIIRSVDEGLDAIRAGRADAFALTRASLTPLLPGASGTRILDGSFNRLGVALAIPKNRPAALAYVTAFTEDLKATRFIQRAFDKAGLKGTVAAPGERYRSSGGE